MGLRFPLYYIFFPSRQHPAGIELAHLFIIEKYVFGFNRPFDESLAPFGRAWGARAACTLVALV
jgi:hypothetical protein